MEVILLEHVDNLGNLGDVVQVKNGYARNYLLPQKKCLRATNENKAIFEAKRAQMEKELEAFKKEATKIAKAVEGIFVVLIRQAGEDGRLFGSVTTKDIAAAITQTGTAVDRRYLRLDKPIKYVGVHPIKVKLHADIIAEVRINVARTEDEAKDAEYLFLNPPAKEEVKYDVEAIAATDAVKSSDTDIEENTEIFEETAPKEKKAKSKKTKN